MYPNLIFCPVIKENKSINLNHMKLPFLLVKNGQITAISCGSATNLTDLLGYLNLLNFSFFMCKNG